MPNPIFTTQSSKDKARYLYEVDCLSAEKVAQYFNCTKPTILNLARKEGWNIREDRNKKFLITQQLIQDNYEDILNMMDDGVSLRKISSIFGIRRQVLSKFAKQMHQPILGHRLWTSTEIEDIIFLYTEEKWHLSRVANFFNCSPDAIRRVLRDNNVRIRGTNEAALIKAEKRFGNIAGAEFKEFKDICRHISNIIYEYGKDILCNGLFMSRGRYTHLDHMFSIRMAYSILSNTGDWNIIWVVSHFRNLSLISSHNNLIKSDNCSISLKALCKKIEFYERTTGGLFANWSEQQQGYLYNDPEFEYIASKVGYSGDYYDYRRYS